MRGHPRLRRHPSLAARRALGTQGTPVNLREDTIKSAFRSLRVYSLSTAALVFLLVRWSKPPARSANTSLVAEQRRAALLSFGKALVSCACDGHDLRVARGRPAGWDDDDDDAIVVPMKCDGGQLDIQDLLRCRYAQHFSFMGKLAGKYMVDAMDFLLMVAASGKGVTDFLLALVLAMSFRVERWATTTVSTAAAPESVGQADVAPDVSRGAARRKAQLNAYKEKNDKEQEQSNLLKHFYSAREHYSNKLNMCMAVDGSRIASARPSSAPSVMWAGWLASQRHRLQSGSSHKTQALPGRFS